MPILACCLGATACSLGEHGAQLASLDAAGCCAADVGVFWKMYVCNPPRSSWGPGVSPSMAGQGGTDLLVAQHRMLAKFLFGPEGWTYVSVVVLVGQASWMPVLLSGRAGGLDPLVSFDYRTVAISMASCCIWPRTSSASRVATALSLARVGRTSRHIELSWHVLWPQWYTRGSAGSSAYGCGLAGPGWRICGFRSGG